jgi:N6-adenosine-specific RNA methylase IME4
MNVVPRFKQKALIKYEPKKAKVKLGGIKAAIAQAAKLQDAAFFEDAVAAYVREQEQFVAWWDANVEEVGGDRQSKKALLQARNNGRVSAQDAETQTGISKWQVSRWRSWLEDDGYVQRLSVKLWRMPFARRDREQMHAEDEVRVKSLVVRPGKYRTLVIDPPWDYEWLSIAGRAKPGYATMTQEELLALDVRGWANDDCHLYCWTTNNFMARACELVAAWGFQHRTVLTWVKPRWGLGSYFRNQSEHVLFATLGELRTRRDDVSTIFHGEMREHSEKPDEFYDLVRSTSYMPCGEAFQRERREGFENLFKESVAA